MTPPDEAPSLLASMPTWILNQASVRAHRLLTDALAGAGSRGYDYRVLAALSEFGPSSQASLGRRVQLDRSDVVATVDALAARGLVTRSRDPDDLRRNMVALTGPGTRHFRQLERIIAGVQEELLASLRPPERRTLLALLRRVADS